MTSSALIAQRIAEAVVGLILAGLSGAVIGSLWPRTGLAAALAFLVAWELEGINTRALQRRHPDLILPRGWKWVRIRYKPLDVHRGEYEVNRAEFIRGQVALIIFGIPLGLFVAAVVGIIWPAGRWLIFIAVFTCWVAIMLLGIAWSITKE